MCLIICFKCIPLLFGARFCCFMENLSPKSPACTRRVFLFRASEGDEGIVNLVVPATDNVKAQLT